MLSKHAIPVAVVVCAALAVLSAPTLASGDQSSPLARAARSPVAVAAASPQCSGATASGAGRRQEHTILCLINAERRRVGVPRLERSGALARAAERHSRDMTRRNYFSHTSPSGATPRQRARRAGYSPAMIGENLAFGTGAWGTPAGTVAQWLDSPGHRRVMLSPDVRDLGVGAVSGSPMADFDGGTTVAAVFGRR